MDKKQLFTTSPTIINCNLFRPYIFILFPNLKEIIINTQQSIDTDDEFHFSFWNFIKLYNIPQWKTTTKMIIKGWEANTLISEGTNYGKKDVFIAEPAIPIRHQSEIISLFAAHGFSAVFNDYGRDRDKSIQNLRYNLVIRNVTSRKNSEMRINY